MQLQTLVSRVSLIDFMEMTSAALTAFAGLMFGVVFLTGFATGRIQGAFVSLVFIVLGALTALLVGFAVWRSVARGEPGWGRTLLLAAIVLTVFALFGGPWLRAAAVFGLLTVVLHGANVLLKHGQNRAAPA